MVQVVGQKFSGESDKWGDVDISHRKTDKQKLWTERPDTAKKNPMETQPWLTSFTVYFKGHLGKADVAWRTGGWLAHS